ncbi:hypothetical protein DL96DRAFT_1710455 [Flagelloscypha sp. PMI_526]|nr:hypothetical protein DL96DRAFT_1710455 [Flagelloscypha sp. PMI_526]
MTASHASILNLFLTNSAITSRPNVISPSFLFTLANALSATSSPTWISKLVPLILRDFRDWRVLPLEVRSSQDVLSDLTTTLLASTATLHPTISVPPRPSPLALSTITRTALVPEHACFRNGCGACRQVRGSSSSRSAPTTNRKRKQVASVHFDTALAPSSKKRARIETVETRSAKAKQNKRRKTLTRVPAPTKASTSIDRRRIFQHRNT